MKCLFDVAEHVSECLQLAMLLEVSAYPKPGNVHRTADFHDTCYEHFLVSAVVVGGTFKEAAQRGILISRGKLKTDQAEIGRIMRDAIEKVSSWIKRGNTVLGTIILLSPLAVSAGMSLTEENPLSIKTLRKNLRLVVESTTPVDALNLYEAIEKVKPGGLGKVPELDVNDPSSKKQLIEQGISLFEVFRIAADYDSVAAEWTNGYHVTFDMGYPYFIKELDRTSNFNIATVHTYLKILSEKPDTLIIRKAGMRKAHEISFQAEKILELGGLNTSQGRLSLVEFDRKLRESGNKLNPGTTADLVSAVLAVAVLEGHCP